MALAIPLHQKALHDASTAAMRAAKNPNWQSGVGQTPAFCTAQTKAEEPVIPAPYVFASLICSTANAHDVPTLGECAAHLELLQAFYAVRRKVLNSKDLDTTFGIKANIRITYHTTYNRFNRPIRHKNKLKDTTFPVRRRQKWPFFLGLAAARFRIWLQKADLAINVPSLGSSVSTTAALPALFLPPLGAF
jgi:hypothetical protein